jgi:hypothetical protein
MISETVATTLRKAHQQLTAEIRELDEARREARRADDADKEAQIEKDILEAMKARHEIEAIFQRQ